MAEEGERPDAPGAAPEAPRVARTARDASPAADPAAPSAAFRPLRKEPARKLVVITCMDARIDPLPLLGLGIGDAHVIRNAGAVVSDDVLRSLKASQAKLGTRRALLIGHTDCAGHDSDAAAAAALADGIRRIRGTSTVPDAFSLEALMYDVSTGTLSPA
jgi:carbonic anhydrase